MNVVRPCDLPDTVHTELAVAQIDTADAQGRGEAGAEGGAAIDAVGGDEVLQAELAGCASGDLADEDHARSVAGEIGVDTAEENGALVDLRSVVELVELGIVWMEGVDHVGRYQERSGEGLLVRCGGTLWFCFSDILFCRECKEGKPADDVWEEVGPAALCGLGADFLVVEERDEPDRLFRVQR